MKVSDPPVQQATPKEKFDVLYATLSQLHEGLIQFELHNGTFLFLIFGWLLTAADAQLLLQASRPIRLALIVTLFGLTGFHAWWVYRHYVRSVAVHQLLLALNYVPASYLESRRIHKGLALSFVGGHALLSLIICFSAWLI
jgi:uncharacterized membrane protein (UPF0136 family)